MSKVTPNYRFKNPHIEKIPPQRDYYHIEHTGVTSKDIKYHLKLESIKTSTLRKHLNKHLDVPPLLGNWELMNHWITNMWEALYNPLWLWIKPNKGYGVMHGHHRFRLLNKMDAEKVWFYGLEAKHHKIGNLIIPPDIKQLMGQNDRAPIKGTVHGVCEACGGRTWWTKKTINRVSDVKMYCKLCGAENPYPWPGQI